MIGLPTGTRVWLVAGVTGMRRGFDGLAAVAQTALEVNPFGGHVFVCCRKPGDLTHQANLADLRFHDLRHGHTGRFFEKGLNVIGTATITVHTSLQMLKRYIHLEAEDLAKKLA